VEEMTPITCDYIKDGCPIYPIWDKEDDEHLYELDNSGALNILSTGEKFDAYQ
jgi:hypothetical protein